MASALIEAPLGATKLAAGAAVGGGRLALSAGEGLIHRVQPGHIPEEVVAQQAILKQFEGKLGIVNFMDEDSTDRKLEVLAYSTADTLVDKGVVDEHGVVELRPVLPEDALWDPTLHERRERAFELLQLALEEEYNVMGLPNSHPIMPSQHMRSPMDANAAWNAIAPELDGLVHQFGNDPEHEPSMLALTNTAYERTMFGGHTAVIGNPRGSSVLALDTVGERPDGNVLAWLHPPIAQAA